MEPIDPAFFEDDDVRAALAARDIGTLYRLLRRVGVSQRQIAQLTSQSQSEVSEIIKGRRVRDVWVLERIADGLGIPRERMGLSYGEEAPDPSSVEKDVDEAMKRRVLLATTMAAALRQGAQALGEPIELALPAGQALPSRLGMSHVHIVRAVTDRLRGVARHHGGQADLFGAAATLYTRWMQVPATEAVNTRLAAALAELHTEAGWACYDSGLDGAGHFTRALRLADKAGDTYGIANAALHAGATLVRNGHPNDALKLFQLGQFHLRGFQPARSTPATLHADDPRLPILTAQLSRQSATAYAVMKGSDEADRCLTEANNGWEPQHAFQRAGADLVTAGIQLDLGQLDTAEQSATKAARAYGENHRRGRTEAQLILAEVHIRAGEPQGLPLARHAIDEVSTLHSVAARRERLIPLATALEARPSTDTRELARISRQIAACGAGDVVPPKTG
ncbi:MAG TPA: helix-turn-helix domain-containing protein [Pseudonocardiaceae bacterium]|nr:helix-turn-helix domain-containing protein [Pseudonocardiaceae bacterium]